MSLDFILLSLLGDPASGYDLKREFEAGAATFWPAQLSQIYPTLKRLESSGLLESSCESSNRGPARRVYVRTSEGSDALKDWLLKGPIVGRERFAYIGQLSSLGHLNDWQYAKEFIEKLRASFVERLQYLRKIEADIVPDTRPAAIDDDSFFDWAALLMGTTALEARIRCCDDLLATMATRRDGSGVEQPATGAGTTNE